MLCGWPAGVTSRLVLAMLARQTEEGPEGPEGGVVGGRLVLCGWPVWVGGKDDVNGHLFASGYVSQAAMKGPEGPGGGSSK